MLRIEKCLDAIIPGGISLKDFVMATGTERAGATVLLEEIITSGIGRREDDMFYFDEADRLRAAILALGGGADIDMVAQKLGWRDFEGLAARILEDAGFAVMRNLMLKAPRMEIDVVGIRFGVAMLIDCKHWKRNTDSALRRIVRKQIARTRHYVASTPGAAAAPVIVTLYRDATGFIDGVPVVPISQLDSFVDEFYGNLDSMRTIRES